MYEDDRAVSDGTECLSKETSDETECPLTVLNMLLKSIDCRQDNYEMNGHVNPPSFFQGRQCILSAGVVDDLWKLMQESPELYLDEIGIWLALYHEVQISTTALHDNLQELGLTCKLMRCAAAEWDHKLHANWMYNILNTYTAKQMVVFDKSSKDDRTLIQKYGRALSGNDPILTVSLVLEYWVHCKISLGAC